MLASVILRDEAVWIAEATCESDPAISEPPADTPTPNPQGMTFVLNCPMRLTSAAMPSWIPAAISMSFAVFMPLNSATSQVFSE